MIKNKDYKLYYKNVNKIKGEGVYLIRNLDNKTLKIGITNDISRRLNEIKKSFKFCGTIPKLEIECFIKYEHNAELEEYLHKQLKEFNHQNEWFNIDDINIVLEKLQDFKYKEPVNQYDINKERRLNKRERERLLYPEYIYYKYRMENNDTNFKQMNAYIRCKGNEHRALECIEKVYFKVTGINHCFYCDDDAEKTITNPLRYELNRDLLELFDLYNTDVIIENDINNYIPLELYYLNKYKDDFFKRFENTKKYIIDKLNNNTLECNNNDSIEKMYLSIGKIESECVEIQKELNNYIRYKNKQNFKRRG